MRIGIFYLILFEYKKDTYGLSIDSGFPLSESTRIDLEASYEGPDAKNKKIVIDKANDENKDKDNNEEDESEGSDNDGSEYDNNLSLAAMEEKLKPKVLNDFNEITKLFKKLQKHSHEYINADKKNEKT